MLRKKKRNLFFGNPIVFTAVILVLNFIGVSYAYWNDKVIVESTMRTGNIDPVFGNVFESTYLKGSGSLDVNFDNQNNTVYVTGEVSTDFTGIIDCELKNQGSIPVKNIETNYNIMSSGLKLEVEQPSEIPALQDSFFGDNSNFSLKIEAVNEGRHEFEIELLYSK